MSDTKKLPDLPPMRPVYIGDGVCAEFDGRDAILRVSRHSEIVIGPEEAQALIRFLRKAYRFEEEQL